MQDDRGNADGINIEPYAPNTGRHWGVGISDNDECYPRSRGDCVKDMEGCLLAATFNLIDAHLRELPSDPIALDARQALQRFAVMRHDEFEED